MYADTVSVGDWEKKRVQREKALQERLKKLPQNVLVKDILNEKSEQNDMEKKDQEWEVVSKLFHEAREMYMDDEKPFKDVTKYLGEAISALSK